MVTLTCYTCHFQYGDDHPGELEALWAALVLCWPNNIRVVMHYLVILINMAATELLSHVRPYTQCSDLNLSVLFLKVFILFLVSIVYSCCVSC